MTQHDVLASVVRGRVVYLALTDAQKRSLRDHDGQLALAVVRHLVGARYGSVAHKPPERFPLTMGTFQAAARKIGHQIGQKHCYALIRRLIEAEILIPSGSYRQGYSTGIPTGFRVDLWRLGGTFAALRAKASVGKRSRVKRRVRSRWWRHELFGDASGRPPPQLKRRDAARMRSLDELDCPRAYGLV
jgi:hypothetical protein